MIEWNSNLVIIVVLCELLLVSVFASQ